MKRKLEIKWWGGGPNLFPLSPALLPSKIPSYASFPAAVRKSTWSLFSLLRLLPVAPSCSLLCP